MDNIENYLYLLFAVIYIISRIIKARAKQQQNTQQPQQRQAQPVVVAKQKDQPQRKKAFSFEDILKEFEKNLGGEEEYEDEKPLPVTEIKHTKPAAVVNAPATSKKNPYESYEGMGYKSSKDIKEADDISIFTRSENYSIKDNLASEYVKMLREPQGFKNAIVLSEIINRKYF